jgi:hypothetical protein
MYIPAILSAGTYAGTRAKCPALTAFKAFPPDLTMNFHSDIDWQATGQAMAKVKISRRHWVSKHSSLFN